MAVLKLASGGDFAVRPFFLEDDLKAAPFMDRIRVSQANDAPSLAETFERMKNALSVCAVGVNPLDLSLPLTATIEDITNALVARAKRSDQDAIWTCYLEIQREAGWEVKDPAQGEAPADPSAEPQTQAS